MPVFIFLLYVLNFESEFLYLKIKISSQLIIKFFDGCKHLMHYINNGTIYYT